MADEKLNEQQEQQEEIKEELQEPEVVEETPVEVVEEEKNEPEEEAIPEIVEETQIDEEVEAPKEEEKQEEVVEEKEPAVEEPITEEVEEAPVEAVEEEVKEEVKAEVNEDLEKVKAELAEKEAELEEEKAIKSYEDDVREANKQLDQFLVNLGNAMTQEFAKYGIDPNTNLDELRKADPAKAQVAENIINQAQAVKAQAMNNVQTNLNDRLTDVVFSKASRLFDKHELTPEQGEVAAETFVNILSQSGIRDMGDDLIAKVELAVARAKYLKPKVEKVIDDAKEVAKEAVEAVKEIIEAKKEKEEKPVEEKQVEEEKKDEPETTVETPTLDEFKESAVTSNQAAGDAITIDNVLAKNAALSFKDRVKFYAEHKELMEQAMARQSEKENNKRRI